MVKSVLSVAKRGLRDWIVQRISAVLMAIYLCWIIFYFVSHSNLSFAEWHFLFSQTWIKIVSILVLLALLFHAWIGMWTIFTDYVKPYALRFILHTLVFLTLIACFIWGLLILWSV